MYMVLFIIATKGDLLFIDKSIRILYNVLKTKLNEDFIRLELCRYIPAARNEELRTKQLFIKYFYQVILYKERKPGIYTEFDDHMRRVIVLEFYRRIIATYLDKSNR